MNGPKYVVIPDVYTTKRHSVVLEMAKWLMFVKGYEKLDFHVRFSGERAYDFKPYPEYEFKKLFAESTDPIEVYTVICLASEPEIESWLVMEIINKARKLGELWDYE